MNMNELCLVQHLGRDESERYEMLTGRRSPWTEAGQKLTRRELRRVGDR